MRTAWKDSNQEQFKVYKYRKNTIQRHYSGWITDLDRDNNIYFSIDCVYNEIVNCFIQQN